MVKIQRKTTRISVFVFLLFTIFIFSAKPAVSDVLFIGERTVAEHRGLIDDEVRGPEDLSAQGALDELFVGEAIVDEELGTENINAVAILTGEVREKLENVNAAIHVAVNEIVSAGIGVEKQWPFALAGLLFVMLMMRFRRRGRKSKF